MQRLEHRRHSGNPTASRSRHRRTAAAPQSVYAELLDQLLVRCSDDAARRSESSTSWPAVVRRCPGSTDPSRASPSAQAAQIRNELARLSLVESVARRSLQPLTLRDAASPPAPDALAGELASQAPWPTGVREETDARHRASRRASPAG